LILLCSPHNPVGRVWTKEELTEIAEICIKNNVKIISDEIHHGLIMKGYQHTVMASIHPKYEDYIVTCTSCSKTFSLAGLKVANTIIKNPEIREAFVKQLSAAGFGGLTNMAYQGCISAYNDAEGWLEECLEGIYENATYLKNYIEEKMPELKAIPLEGTYLQWLDFRGLSVSLDELKVQLTKHDLYFNDGAVFGENGAYFQRINLACPKVVLEKAMDRLYDMVKELRHE